MAKKKRRSNRTVAGVRRRWRIESKPAKASEYLHHLDEYHKQYPNIQAIIYCRDSTGMQGYKRNLDTYEKKLRRELKKRNIPIVGCHREISSGWVLNDDRWALVNATKKARKHKRKRTTVIVAPSSDRFLRNKYFTTKEPDILPTEAEFEKLKELTCDVPLVTLLDPDMPPKKVRGYQSKWGQQAKGNKGGRPKKNKPGYKKQRRLEKLPRVLRMYRKHNKNISLRDIAAVTGIPKPTVWYWIKKYGDKTV